MATIDHRATHDLYAAAARRVRPSDVVLAIWVGFAIVTIVSGVTGVIFEFHDDSAGVTARSSAASPARCDSRSTSSPRCSSSPAAVLFWQRVRNWERGAPDDAPPPRRTSSGASRDFRAGVYMQTLLRDPAAGVMHSLIYFSFLILLGVTTVLEIDHQMPESAKFLHGGVYQGYSAVGDAAGVVFLVGVLLGDRPPLRAAARTASASRPSPSTR